MLIARKIKVLLTNRNKISGFEESKATIVTKQLKWITLKLKIESALSRGTSIKNNTKRLIKSIANIETLAVKIVRLDKKILTLSKKNLRIEKDLARKHINIPTIPKSKKK